jgi:NAD(P)-dependent dehydrogenase (short-subunit alcohol dehydrogenase family)
MRLNGKTALVTGATSGIGRATAEAFAHEGAELVVTGRDAQRAAQVVGGIIDSGGRARSVVVDLRQPDGVQRLAAEAGPVDILVNNAGVYRFASTGDTDRATYDETMDVNVRVPFFLTAVIGGQMAARRTGKIVNISSLASQVGTATGALYGASKAALEALTRAWAAEFGPHGVNVNAVAPGPTHTPGTAGFGAGLAALTNAFPAGRPAQPAEIARAVVFLASNEADFVHGVTLLVDGGGAAI